MFTTKRPLQCRASAEFHPSVRQLKLSIVAPISASLLPVEKQTLPAPGILEQACKVTFLSASEVSSIVYLILILLGPILLAPIFVGAQTVSEPARSNYVGDDACRPCHDAIRSSYHLTAHHQTSKVANRESIAGSFAAGKNRLKTSDKDLQFRMDARKDGFYQAAVFFQPPDQKLISQRIDFVVGSGGKGQTYLYWKEDRLFELPVSYWSSVAAWVNSPGYPDGTADFQRPVVPRCLECHASYFQKLPGELPENRYGKQGVVLGISCERCHGPGQPHVQAERAHRESEVNRRIVNPGKLGRDRQIEVCAQCHGGIGEQLLPAFSFVPGEPLTRFINLHSPEINAKVDVHGNQVALLQRSRCYQISGTMTCGTCHNSHQPEKVAASYTEKCLTCHQPENCGLFPKRGAKLAEDCVSCHMPVQESEAIVSTVGGRQVKDLIRTHWIKAYLQQLSPAER
jgi:hypothetical protein